MAFLIESDWGFFFSFCKKYHLISLSEFPPNNWEREAGAKNIIKRHLSLEIHIMKLGGRTHKKIFREQKGVPLLFPLE